MSIEKEDSGAISNATGDESSTYDCFSSDSESETFAGKDLVYKPDLGAQLAQWAVECNISHSALGSLLIILTSHHNNLPVDPRTLLRTPTQYNIKQIVGAGGPVGEYYHFGIGSGIATKLASCKSYDTTHLLWR